MSVMKSLSLYVSAISRVVDINITFGGNEAYCEKLHTGWTVNIPVFDSSNEETCAAAFAYALHESGHVKYTNFEDLTKYLPSLPFNPKIVDHVSNIFEDVYIERFLTKCLKGAFSRLSKMRVWLNKQDPQSEDEIKNASTSTLILQLIYMQSFTESGYEAYAKDLLLITTEVVSRTGDDFVNELKAILKRCSTLSSTMDCIYLTRDVLQFLADKNQESDQENRKMPQKGSSDEKSTDKQKSDTDSKDDNQSNGNQQNGDESKDDNSQSNGNQKNGDESKDDNSQSNGNQKNGDESKDDNSQSNGNQQNGDESKANKQSNVNSNQHQQISDATKEILDGDAKNPMETDVGKVLAEKLSNQSKEDVKEGKVDSTDLRDSNQLNSTNIIEEEMKEDLRYVKMLSECAEKQTVFVRNRIRNLIASKMLVKMSRKMTGRRLISTACSKLAVGDSRVFQKKQQQKMENTAITILLDDSGSMDGESGQVAAIATQAIIQAISPINFVSTSVLAFGSHSCTNKIYRIKTFDESPYRCIKRLSSHLSKEGCETPLLTGLWSGLKELSERQESRKVMLVITDGAPNSKAACSQLITRIRQSSDIEVFGIGITKAKHLVGALFGEKYAVSIDDINQLADEIFKLAEQILIK